MDKIRVNSGTLNIEVNDKGEYITLKLRDQEFVMKLLNLINSIIELIPSVNSLNYDEISAQVRDDINNVFGENACEKIFGCTLPAFDLYIDFFEQLTPYVESYFDKRKKELEEKYSVGRVGNV